MVKGLVATLFLFLCAAGVGCSDESGTIGGGENSQAGNQGSQGGSQQGGNSSGCSPATCSGCCNGSTCVTVGNQDAGKCGKAGVACSPCDAGFACGAGSCVVDTGSCSAASCPTGCCSENVCITADKRDWQACGPGGGGACKVCGTGALCTAQGTCDEGRWSPNARIKMTINQMVISGSACDDGLGGGAPDPFLSITVEGQTFESVTCNDTQNCSFNKFSLENMVPTDFTSGQTALRIYDEDVSSDDLCWSGKFQFPAPLERRSGLYKMPTSSDLIELSFVLEGMP